MNNFIKRLPDNSLTAAKKLFRTTYIFPISLFMFLLFVTVFSLHGSSVGLYDQILTRGDSSQNALAGQPRIIRTDEWYVNTPYIIGQASNNYPEFNEDIAEGQDMSLILDVPYRDWSILLRPQNLIFLVLPLENAFAFKWWLLCLILMLATYFFTLLILPGKRLVAVLLAVSIAWSPFTQWWYQSITVLPIAYTLALVTLAVYLTRSRSTKVKLLLSLAIAYIATAFVLILYPPFQIACALTGLCLFIGIYYGENKTPWRTFIKQRHWLWLALSAVVSLVLAGTFIIQKLDTIALISNTFYPGTRNISSGGMSISSLTSWPISYITLDDSLGGALGYNQSESSSFLLFGILLVPFLCYRFFGKNRVIDKKLLYTFVITLLALTLFSIRALTPFGNSFFKLLFLDSVPHSRLMIGIGVLNIVMIIIALGLPAKRMTTWKSLLSSTNVAVFAYSYILVFGGLVLTIRSLSPAGVGYIESAAVSLFCACVVTLIALQESRARLLGLIMLVGFSLFVSTSIQPVYQGLGAINNGSIVNSIRKLEASDKSRWIALDQTRLEPVLIASGAETISGVQTYPQLQLWEKYFLGQERIYNRYAHVTYRVDDSLASRSMELLHGDAFRVSLPSCDEFLATESVDYILGHAHNGSEYDCFEILEKFMTDDKTIAIYKRISAE